MLLTDLLGANGNVEKIDIAGLTADSRAVEPGYLFAALPGAKLDGRKFIPQAIERGARAILAPTGTELPSNTAILVEDLNPRRRYAHLAARFYPLQPKSIAAVTGTNGKSSVVSFVRQLWALLGEKAASIGTLGVDSPVYSAPGGLTTPDPVGLHQVLQELVQRGVGHVALEASSHGLAQYRLDGVKITSAGFTNLSRDHLDYHGSFEAYLFAKARLFGELLTPHGHAVINVDSNYGREIENLTWARGIRIISVGRAADALLRLTRCEAVPEGLALSIDHEGSTYDMTLPLSGDFQAENALVAAGLVMAEGFDAARVLPLLARLGGVPGRMEFIGETAQGAKVYVDYAHTPDGLENVLKAARRHADGRVLVVFGCGGDRDRGKRRIMGKLAAEHADLAFITDDNPRTEDAAAIRAEVLAGCPDGRDVGDRAAAIAAALDKGNPGDVIVVAGKGHEDGQVVGTETLPFSDRGTILGLIGRSEGEGE